LRIDCGLIADLWGSLAFSCRSKYPIGNKSTIEQSKIINKSAILNPQSAM